MTLEQEKQKIYLKLALLINEKLYEKEKITFKTYQVTKNNLLKKLGD